MKSLFILSSRCSLVPMIKNPGYRIDPVTFGSAVVRVFARYARSHGFESRSGMCFFLPCDIWWLSGGVCSGCEQQSVSLVPAWFRADSGTNLIKQEKLPHVDHVAR